MLARQGGGSAGPGDPGRPGFAFWRRRQRAEAEAREARAAAAEAEAREAKAAAEQQARAAQEQVAAERQERDEAVAGAQSQAAEAESRADQAGQDPVGFHNGTSSSASFDAEEPASSTIQSVSQADEHQIQHPYSHKSVILPANQLLPQANQQVSGVCPVLEPYKYLQLAGQRVGELTAGRRR